MDETLELRLIESCYDSAKARQVSLKKAGEIIRDEIFGSARDNPAGALYFDGWAQVIVRTGLGHSIMNGQSLAVTGGDLRKGLFVYSVQDDLDGQRSSVFVEGAGGYRVVVQKKEALTSDNSLNLFVKTEDEVRDSAKVEITEGGETRILYLPKVGIVQMDKLFWKHVAGRCGLRLTEIDPQYKGKEPLTPWYTAMHKESGVVLTLGTRNSVYAVKAEFPEAKGAAQLRELVDGLHVNPQTVDGQWIGPKMPSGRQFETHIDLGLGNEVVAYIDRLLGNTDLAPALSK